MAGRFGLGARIFAATAGIVLVTLAATTTAAWLGASRAADRAVTQGLARTRAQVRDLLAGRERQMRGSATVFAQDPRLVSGVVSATSADWYDRAVEAQEQAGADWAQITDAEGVRIARSDDPAAPRDSLGGTSLVSGALEGEVVSGFGVMGDSALFQAVSVPIANPSASGPPVGTLQVARMVDSTLVRQLREASESEVVLYALDREDRPRVVAASIVVDSALRAMIAERVASADTATRDGAAADTAHARLRAADGREWVAQRGVLRSASGGELGGFVVLRSRRAELAAFDTLWTGIAVAGALGLLLATAVAGVVARRIAKPVRALAAATRRAADGDYDAPIPQASGEVGALAVAVRTMLADLRDKQALVAALGDGERAARVSAAATLPVRGTAWRADFTDGGEPAPGRLFAGRYEVIALLGTGGMGKVYKARDRELGETVAIKTLRRESAELDPTSLDRFRDEIRLARRISHRAVVRTHDVGQAGGVHYITMEYVEGTPLSELIRARGRLSAFVTVSIGKQLARALEAAHEQGVLHRDVKPQNIIVTGDGLLKVMDFGIARVVASEQRMTQTGVIVGTPAYMAPEQLEGSAGLDARVDVYASGVVLYECLAGVPPFRGESAYEVIASSLVDTPRPLWEAAPGAPPQLVDVVMHAMAKRRDARIASAAALHAALERIEEDLRAAEPRYATAHASAGA